MHRLRELRKQPAKMWPGGGEQTSDVWQARALHSVLQCPALWLVSACPELHARTGTCGQGIAEFRREGTLVRVNATAWQRFAGLIATLALTLRPLRLRFQPTQLINHPLLATVYTRKFDNRYTIVYDAYCATPT